MTLPTTIPSRDHSWFTRIRQTVRRTAVPLLAGGPQISLPARVITGLILALLFTASARDALASPPTTPTGLTAVPASASQVSLSWTASTDSGAAITSYVIQRCTGSSCTTFSQVGTVSGSTTTFLDSTLTSSTTYRYEVYAKDATSQSGNSNIANAATYASSVASSVTYAYDALGRVTQANVAALNIVENYTYDASGNILSVTSSPIATLEVANFSNPQGSVGNQITILGSGFSTTPSSNTVKFNGTTATVVSATSTQLVVTVPTGATTGSVTVKTGTTTVTSPGTFTVTASQAATTVTSFSPLVVGPGSTVTITGTGFSTILSNDKVSINDTWATVVAATTTSLTLVVPSLPVATSGMEIPNGAAATSGVVTVITPQGSATSSTNLTVFSQPVNSTETAAVNGGSVNVTGVGNSSYDLVLFSGIAGSNVTVDVTNASLPGTALSVIAPNGSTIVTAVPVTASGQGIPIPALPETGTYTIAIQEAGSSGSLTLNLLAAISSSLTLNGTPQNVTIAVPGQVAALTFAGTANTYVTLALTNVTLSAATVSILAPSGTVLVSSSVTTAGATLLPLLPASGTYTVLVTPTGALSGSFTAALTSTSTQTLNPNPTQGPYNLSLNDTNPVTLTFDGASGQYFSLAATESGSLSNLSVNVLNPDGSTLYSTTWCNSCGAMFFNLGPLAQSGSYSLVVQQTAAGSGSLALTLTTPLTAAANLGGSNPAVNITLAGRSVAETFTGVAGQYVSAAFAENTGGSIEGGATISLIGPDGTLVASGTLSGTNAGSGCGQSSSCIGSGVVSFGPLPSSGTYIALMQQSASAAVAGTATLAFTLEPATSGSLTLGGTSNVSVLNGQGLTETFAGTSGQYVSFELQTSSTGSAPISGTIEIVDPSGAILTTSPFTGSCGTGCSGYGQANVGPLALTGNYTLVFLQTTGSNGTSAGTVSITPSIAVSGSLSFGSTSNVSMSSTGQGFSETFTGTAGQYLSFALNLQGQSSTIISGTVLVLSPTGAVIATAPYQGICNGMCSAGGNIALGPLPTSGTYTLVFEQTASSGAAPGTGTIAVTASTAASGSLTLGAPSTFTLSAGQGISATFTASAGDYDSVTLSETAGLVQGADISVLTSSGAIIGVGSFGGSCSSSCSGTSIITVGPLPAGTYTVLMQQRSEPAGYGTGPMTLQVNKLNVGGATTDSLQTTTNGQSATFTFNGTANANTSLALTGLTLTPSSVTTVTVTVTDPNSNPILVNTCETGGAGCLYAMTPQVTGTYTVTVTPSGQATMTGTATVAPALNAALSGSTPLIVNLSAIGQGASIGFNLSSSQGATLYFSGVSSNPAGTYYEGLVNGPNGPIASVQFTTDTVLDLSNLAPGTYVLALAPETAATGQMTVTLYPGVVDTLPASGTGMPLSTVAPGESAYVDFVANYGSSVGLALSNLTFTPTSITSVQVSWPPIALLTESQTCMAAGCVIHMPYLPYTGTFTLPVTAASGTFSGTATLSADVTGALTLATPLTLTLSELGQSALLTFAVSSEIGQTLALNIASFASNPVGLSYNVTVYALSAENAIVASGTASSATTLNLPSLVPGSYAVMITPSGAPCTGSMQVTLQPGVSIVLPTNGSQQSVSTTVQGENVYSSFTANAGQNLTITLSSIAFTPSTSGSLQVSVTAPGGASVGSTYCTAGASCQLPLTSLPATGGYSIVVMPPAMNTMSFGLTAQ